MKIKTLKITVCFRSTGCVTRSISKTVSLNATVLSICLKTNKKTLRTTNNLPKTKKK